MFASCCFPTPALDDGWSGSSTTLQQETESLEEVVLLQELKELADYLVEEQKRAVQDFIVLLHERLKGKGSDFGKVLEVSEVEGKIEEEEPHLSEAESSDVGPMREAAMDMAEQQFQQQVLGKVSTDLHKVSWDQEHAHSLPKFATLSGKFHTDPVTGVQGFSPGVTTSFSDEAHMECGDRSWFLKWFGPREEPERTGFLFSVIDHRYFRALTIFIIWLNGLLVLYQADQAAILARRREGPSSSVAWVDVVELVFVIYFAVELILKLMVHRCYFFCAKDRWQDMWWNIFDAITIVSAVAEIFMNTLGVTDGGFDPGFLRVLRIFRLTRSMRIVRALHIIQGLRQLMDCIVSSFANLFWCVILLLFLTGIFAVFIVQTTTVYWQEGRDLEDTDNEYLKMKLEESFGSVRSGMFSLFKITSGGADWGPFYEYLSLTGRLGPLILVFYILFFMIAAWNIVTSLFLEKALALAQPDIETQMLMKKRQDMADAKELMHLIQTIDEDKSGTVSLEEWKTYMAEPRFRHFLELKDIDIKDAELFFHMLEAAVHNDEIMLSVVVDGLMRMRGVATNLDLQALNFTIHTIHTAFDKNLQAVLRKIQHVSTELHSLTRVPALPPAMAQRSLDAMAQRSLDARARCSLETL